MASQGKNKRKTKGVKVNLQTFLSDETEAPQGFAVAKPLNWADEDDDDEEDKYYETKTSTNKVILPTVPKSIRTPDFDVTKVPDRPPFKAYLGNLPYEVTEEEIIRFFKKLTVSNVTLIRDGERGRAKGMGFVEFEDRESLIEALQQNGDSLKNRSIRVSLSETMDNDRPPRGGLGGNRDDREDRTASDWRSRAKEPDQPLLSRNGSDYQTPYESQPYRGRYSYDRNERRGGEGFERGSYQRNERDFRDRDSSDRSFGSGRGGGGFRDRDRDYGFRDERSGGGGGGFGFDNRRDRYRDNRYSDNNRDYRDGGDRGDRSDRGDRGDRGGDRFDRGDRSDRSEGGDRGDRPSGRRYGSDYEPRSSQRYSPTALSTDSKNNDDIPKERPKLKLQPRTKPIEISTQETSTNSAIFGGAKPVDTAAREREIEEKLAKEAKEKEALLSDTASSKGSISGQRPLRLSTDGSIDGDSRSEDRSDASPKETDSKKSE